MRSSSFWHSRPKLATACISLILIIFVIDLREIKDESAGSERAQTESDILGDYFADSRAAYEAIQYMHNLSTGRAHIRAVVEQEHPIEEWYWFCWITKPLAEFQTGWTYATDQIQMYSAYYDRRNSSLYPDAHSIQVLAMSASTIENVTNIYCTIYSNGGNVVVKAYIREIWQRAWDPRQGFYAPNLITCPIPRRLRELQSYNISLTTVPCVQPKSSITVSKKEPEKRKRVAVCVKGMDFQEEISSFFLEWLESQYLFGADKVVVYTYSVSENTQKILEYFQVRGTLDWIKLDLPHGFPNKPDERSAYIWRNRQQKRRMELIPYNDCLYRHIETHDYILVVDTDELVVPLQHDNWTAILDEVESHQKERLISSISLRNVFKFPPKNETFPDYQFLVSNRKRSEKTSRKGDYGKSFSNTQNVASVFNHFALHRLSSKVSGSISVPEEVAVKLHYKSKCPIESGSECEELSRDTVVDTSLDRWAEQITKRTMNTARTLGFV